MILGASDYIYKPFDRDILISRIKNTVLRNKRIERLTEDATIDKLTGFLNKKSDMRRETGCLPPLPMSSDEIPEDRILSAGSAAMNGSGVRCVRNRITV